MAGAIVGFERFREVSQRRQRMAAEFAQLAAESEAELNAQAAASGEPLDETADAGCGTSTGAEPGPPGRPASPKAGASSPIATFVRSRRDRDAV
jgi:hypothetical protein